MYKLPEGEYRIAIYNIKSHSQSKQIQDVLFKSGFLWGGNGTEYKNMDNKSLHPWEDGTICYEDRTSKRDDHDMSAEEFILRYSQNRPVTRRIHK